MNKKRWRKKLKKAKTALQKAQKRLGDLEGEIGVRDEQIAELERRLEGRERIGRGGDESAEEFAGEGESGIASAQRKAWKRHEFLRTRYEVHLAGGMTKDEARTRANRDYTARFGRDAGYTTRQLQEILS